MKDFIQPTRNELVWFTWKVSVEGYEWRTSRVGITEHPAPVHRYLIDRQWKKSKIQIFEYAVFEEHPSLFHDFARLPRTEEAIIDFANQYGRLGKVMVLAQDTLGPILSGEPLDLWEQEISSMNRLIKIWEWIRWEQTEKLEGLFRWKKTRSSTTFLEYRWKPSKEFNGEDFERLASSFAHPEVFQRIPEGDVISAAKFLLVRRINRKLTEDTSASLLLHDDGIMRPHIIPGTLLSALWLQFFRWLTGERRYIRCHVCQAWMDVTDSRSHKRTHSQCSRRVKQAKWRKSKELKKSEESESALLVNKRKKQPIKKRRTPNGKT